MSYSKVLIIDDELDMRETLIDILEIENSYQVIPAVNGQEGVFLAIRHKPSLILCDVMMPELDGYETIKLIRENDALYHVPFIFLTAKSERKDMRKGMDLGADDFLTKPFVANELLNVVRQRLGRYKKFKAGFEERLEKLKTEVEDQNKRLDQFAFINSHKLRGPLARVMGLINYMTFEFSSQQGIDISTIEKLEEACKEMDFIIHRINEVLTKGDASSLITP